MEIDEASFNYSDVYASITYLTSFSMMLPCFMRYDHLHYARRGPVCLAEIHQLPEYIKYEFMKGNMFVKRSSTSFNKVDPYQATEWLNVTHLMIVLHNRI